MPISPQRLEELLNRWTGATVIDVATADRIRSYETQQQSGLRLRWPVLLAIAFGALMVASGILLFIASHWNDLSPAQQFTLVLVMVAGFHIAAGFAHQRFQALALALHAVGTIALGGGIFLAGQIFNLQEHWPGGILLWAIGSVLAWALLRDNAQAPLSALLVPGWIASEWSVRYQHFQWTERTVAEFVLAVAITYLTARTARDGSAFRQALGWIGGIVLLPAVGAAIACAGESYGEHNHPLPTMAMRVAALLFVIVLPLLVSWRLRGRAAVWNAAALAWVVILVSLNHRQWLQELAIYGWCILGAIGLVFWGLHEDRRERIDLGIAGFAITLLFFYFSAIIDKLGRSATLISFGLIFLLGGWQLEKLRRRLVARTSGGVR